MTWSLPTYLPQFLFLAAARQPTASTNADLTGAKLIDANLSNANLILVDLTNTNLTGVSSGGIVGTASDLPTNWQLTVGYLIGPHANLSGADLANADLTGATLYLADLTDATLTDANLDSVDLYRADLDDAVLTGADLTSADLTGATFSPGTTLYDGQTVAQHGFDAASLETYLKASPVSAWRANNLTLIPEPASVFLLLTALLTLARVRF